jgi:hypothetical protein
LWDDDDDDDDDDYPVARTTLSAGQEMGRTKLKLHITRSLFPLLMTQSCKCARQGYRNVAPLAGKSSAVPS